MFLTNLRNWFASRSQQSSPRRRPSASLQVESLEAREVLSWSTVPSTFGWPSSTNVGFNSNGRSGTAIISNNEVDVYNFVAPRTATYTFTAGKNGSQVDTLAGLFQWSGKRVAGNDNYNGTDSRFTAHLVAGTKYAFAVTNRTGTSTGGYKWSITGPPLSVGKDHNVGSGITSFASASLSGNKLSIYLAGYNSSNWYTHTHRVDVYLLGANNKPIHSGSLWVSVKTSGSLVFKGAPGYDSHSATHDLSGWDLRGLRNIRIVVS